MSKKTHVFDVWYTEEFDGVPVTERQLDVLLAIEAFWRDNFYSPSVQNIADRIGCSKQQAYNHMKKLMKMGLFEKEEGERMYLGVRETKTLRTQVRFERGGSYVFWS